MHSPEIAEENEVLRALRLGRKEISHGIEKEIDELHELSPVKRGLEIGTLLTLYGTGVFLLTYPGGILPLSVCGIVCMGLAFNMLGILIHEGLHGLLAKRPWLNHCLSFLVGIPLFASPTAYQVTHANHHFELGRKLDYGTYRQHFRKTAFVWIAYFFQLFLGTFLYILFVPFVAFPTASTRSRLVIIAEYCILFTIAVFLFRTFPPATLLLYWFYPLVFCSFLTNIRGLASHALGDVENIYLSSRTIKSSKLVSWLFMHENYHLEHHVFPSAPSYHLGKIHGLIWDRLPEGLYSRSYSGFLFGFLRAASRNDLNPLGIVRPGHEESSPSVAEGNSSSAG
jgi:fatty acid desaturase